MLCKDSTEDPVLHNKHEHGTMENSVADLFGNLQGSDALPMRFASHDQRGGVPSMAELLEDLQHEDEPPTVPLNLVCIFNLCLFEWIPLMTILNSSY